VGGATEGAAGVGKEGCSGKTYGTQKRQHSSRPHIGGGRASPGLGEPLFRSRHRRDQRSPTPPPPLPPEGWVTRGVGGGRAEKPWPSATLTIFVFLYIEGGGGRTGAHRQHRWRRSTSPPAPAAWRWRTTGALGPWRQLPTESAGGRPWKCRGAPIAGGRENYRGV